MPAFSIGTEAFSSFPHSLKPIGLETSGGKVAGRTRISASAHFHFGVLCDTGFMIKQLPQRHLLSC